MYWPRCFWPRLLCRLRAGGVNLDEAARRIGRSKTIAVRIEQLRLEKNEQTYAAQEKLPKARKDFKALLREDPTLKQQHERALLTRHLAVECPAITQQTTAAIFPFKQDVNSLRPSPEKSPPAMAYKSSCPTRTTSHAPSAHPSTSLRSWPLALSLSSPRRPLTR